MQRRAPAPQTSPTSLGPGCPLGPGSGCRRPPGWRVGEAGRCFPGFFFWWGLNPLGRGAEGIRGGAAPRERWGERGGRDKGRRRGWDGGEGDGSWGLGCAWDAALWDPEVVPGGPTGMVPKPREPRVVLKRGGTSGGPHEPGVVPKSPGWLPSREAPGMVPTSHWMLPRIPGWSSNREAPRMVPVAWDGSHGLGWSPRAWDGPQAWGQSRWFPRALGWSLRFRGGPQTGRHFGCSHRCSGCPQEPRIVPEIPGWRHLG